MILAPLSLPFERDWPRTRTDAAAASAPAASFRRRRGRPSSPPLTLDHRPDPTSTFPQPIIQLPGKTSAAKIGPLHTRSRSDA